jgi:hypothetical protein
LRTEIESFNLTDYRLQQVQRNAAGQLVPILSQQKAPVGRSIISGETDEFLVEALKAQTEAERLCVLKKKFACLFNLRR